MLHGVEKIFNSFIKESSKRNEIKWHLAWLLFYITEKPVLSLARRMSKVFEVDWIQNVADMFQTHQSTVHTHKYTCD